MHLSCLPGPSIHCPARLTPAGLDAARWQADRSLLFSCHAVQFDLPTEVSDIEIEDMAVGSAPTSAPWPGAISMDLRETGLSASDLSGEIDRMVSRADFTESAEHNPAADRK